MQSIEKEVTKEYWQKNFSHLTPCRSYTENGVPVFHYKIFSSFGSTSSTPVVDRYYIITVTDWKDYNGPAIG